jgi:lysophospholipase L1-like esterase
MAENLVFLLFLGVLFLAGGLYFLFLLYNKASKVKAGWFRVIVGNILLLFLLLSISFVVGETYYRYLYNTTDALTYTKVSERWFHRYYILNASGFRDNIEYSPTIKPGKRRITFLGDSFTAGHGVKNVEDRFANIIRRLHPEYEVQVLAKLGLDTGAELALMQAAVKQKYQLDQVVLVYCLNDVADILPEWNRALRQIFADVNRGGWLRQNSYFFDTLYHRYKVLRNPYMRKYFYFVREGYEGAAWELQKKRLNQLRLLVESHGGRLLVVIFPFLHMTQAYDEFRPVHQKLDQFWEESGVPCLDLLPFFEGLPPKKITINRFDPHPNEFAHALAAKKIDQFLSEQLRGDPRPVTSRLK